MSETKPDFNRLGAETPFSVTEWRTAWEMLEADGFTAAWSTLRELVRASHSPPVVVAERIILAREKP